MPLLDTPQAINWLSQFRERQRDEEFARTLLNSLRLVSHNTFHQELLETITRAVATLASPIPFYCAHDLPEEAIYFPNQRGCPAAVGNGREVGSEGVLADVATNWNRSDPKRFLNHPPITTLRKKRCRNIIILDDLSGSGQTIADFICAMLRERHLKSWWSFGWLTFHVVAYAISDEAEELVREALRTHRSNHANTHLRFWYSRRPIAGKQLWGDQLRNQIEELCERYGKSGKVRWVYRRGYRESMGTVVFAHGCPNNVPGILWHLSNSWRPLFPNRTVPSVLFPAFDQSGPLLGPSGLLNALEATTLARDPVIDRLTPMGQNMVLVLTALRKKVTAPDRLSLATNLSLRTCDEVIACCLNLGLIDQNRQLTRRGTEELRAVNRLGKLPFEPPAFDGSFYFPKQLRAARD